MPYQNPFGSSLTAPAASSTRNPWVSSRSTAPAPSQPQVGQSRGRGAPERFSIDNPFHVVSQTSANLFAAAGQFPSQIAETPFSLVDTASQRALGYSPLQALGSIPGVSQAGGFLGEAVERVGNFMPAIFNAQDMRMIEEFGDKPDDFELPWHSGQRSEGVPILGAVPGLQLLFSKAKTVGELKRELEKRGFLVDPKTGEQRSWQQIVGMLRTGQTGVFDFGNRSINDNPLLDLAGRIAIDPTNLLFFVPGANVARGAALGAKVAKGIETAADVQQVLRPALNVVPTLERAGIRAATLPAPVVAKEAVAAGNASLITMRGMSSFLKDVLAAPTSGALSVARRAADPRGYLGLTDGALTATSGLGRAGQAVARGARGYALSSTALSATLGATGYTANFVDDALGGNTFFQGYHDFVLDVEKGNPLSENAAWMLASAFAFPYGDMARGAKAGTARAALDAFGSDFEVALAGKFGFGKNRAGIQQFREAMGGPEAVNRLIAYLVKHDAASTLDQRPMVGARAQSAPTAAVRARWADETLASVGIARLRGGKIKGERLVEMLEDWHAEQMGFKVKTGKGEQQLGADVRRAPWDPQLALRRWKRYDFIQSTIGKGMQELADGIMGIGLRDYLFREQFSEIHARLKAAVDDDGIVSQAEIRSVLEDYPALAISDDKGYWKNAALDDAKPVTWNSVRAKLGKQGKHATSIEEALGEASIKEQQVAQDDAPSVVEPVDQRLERLLDEYEQHLDWADPGEKPPNDPEMLKLDPKDPADKAVLTEYFDRLRTAERAWNAELTRGVALGKITPEDATARGWRISSGRTDQVVPLPETLYHATTALRAVQRDGLKTGEEVGRTGLGGTPEYISFTTDRSVADRIAEVFHEVRAVLRGEITIPDLMARAEEAGFLRQWVQAKVGNQIPFETQGMARFRRMFIEHMQRETSIGSPRPVDDLPAGSVWDNDAVIRGGDGVERVMAWERPMTPEEARTADLEAYRAFLLSQDIAGGPMDPLFFLPDVDQLANLDPADIGVVAAHPVPGAHGFPVSSMGEWRAFTGDSVWVEGGPRPGYLDDARRLEIEAELKEYADNASKVRAIRRFEADRAQVGDEGADTLASLEDEAALPELRLNETTAWFDAELRQQALEWERMILEIDPTYTVKALPRNQVLVQMRAGDPIPPRVFGGQKPDAVDRLQGTGTIPSLSELSDVAVPGQHVYHLTPQANFASIRRAGLRPGKVRPDEPTGVYFGKEAADLVTLVPQRNAGNAVLLRMRREAADLEVTDIYQGKIDGELVSRESVPPQALEYLAGDGHWYSVFDPPSMGGDSGIYHALKARTLLGELLFDRGPLAPLTGFMHQLMKPVKGDKLARESRQMLYERMIPHGAKPEAINQWIAKMQEAADKFSFESRGQRFGFYRDVSSLPASAINRTAREVFGENSRIVKEYDGRFHDLLDNASSRFWRAQRQTARKGGRRGEFARNLERSHQVWQEDLGVLSSPTRLVGKTFYNLFRFLMDPRWIALNLAERNFLSGVEDGILRGAKRDSQATAFYASGARRLDEAAMADIVGDTGWYYGRGIMSQVGASFDKRRLQSVEETLNAIGKTDAAALNTIRTRMRRDAEADLAAARKAREAGEDIDLADVERRANLDIENSNRDLAEMLDEKMYAFDQKGVQQTIIDEAKAILDEDELTVLQPLLDVLYERNEQLWKDVNRLYHGNPERSTLERVLNSYWLYWPISYQIKAVKWLAGSMLDGSFGHDNGALLAGRYALWQEQHEERFKNNPAYAAMFEENPDLWMMAGMVLPITPIDIGVSLSRPTRVVGSLVPGTTAEQEAADDWQGIFGQYKQVEGPLSAAAYITNLGPIFTWHLMQEIEADVRGSRFIPAFQTEPEAAPEEAQPIAFPSQRPLLPARLAPSTP